MLVLLLIGAVWCTLAWLFVVLMRLRRQAGTVWPSAAILVIVGIWAGSTFRLLNRLDKVFGLELATGHAPIFGFFQAAFLTVGGLLVLRESATSVRKLEVARMVARSIERRLPDREWIAAAELTPREVQVLRELMDGAVDNDEIGKRLGISSHTAATHVRNIMAKLDVRSREDLILLDPAALGAEEGGPGAGNPVPREIPAKK